MHPQHRVKARPRETVDKEGEKHVFSPLCGEQPKIKKIDFP